MILVIVSSLVVVIRWVWFWVFLGLVLDISLYGSSLYISRSRFADYSRT